MRVMPDRLDFLFTTLVGLNGGWRGAIGRIVPNLINQSVIPADPNDAVESIASAGPPVAARGSALMSPS